MRDKTVNQKLLTRTEVEALKKQCVGDTGHFAGKCRRLIEDWERLVFLLEAAGVIVPEK